MYVRHLGGRCISPSATGQTKVASYSSCSLLSLFTKLLNVMWHDFYNSITGSRVLWWRRIDFLGSILGLVSYRLVPDFIILLLHSAANQLLVCKVLPKDYTIIIHRAAGQRLLSPMPFVHRVQYICRTEHKAQHKYTENWSLTFITRKFLFLLVMLT